MNDDDYIAYGFGSPCTIINIDEKPSTRIFKAKMEDRIRKKRPPGENLINLYCDGSNWFIEE